MVFDDLIELCALVPVRSLSECLDFILDVLDTHCIRHRLTHKLFWLYAPLVQFGKFPDLLSKLVSFFRALPVSRISVPQEKLLKGFQWTVIIGK